MILGPFPYVGMKAKIIRIMTSMLTQNITPVKDYTGHNGACLNGDIKNFLKHSVCFIPKRLRARKHMFL